MEAAWLRYPKSPPGEPGGDEVPWPPEHRRERCVPCGSRGSQAKPRGRRGALACSNSKGNAASPVAPAEPRRARGTTRCPGRATPKRTLRLLWLPREPRRVRGTTRCPGFARTLKGTRRLLWLSGASAAPERSAPWLIEDGRGKVRACRERCSCSSSSPVARARLRSPAILGHRCGRRDRTSSQPSGHGESKCGELSAGSTGSSAGSSPARASPRLVLVTPG